MDMMYMRVLFQMTSYFKVNRKPYLLSETTGVKDIGLRDSVENP